MQVITHPTSAVTHRRPNQWFGRTRICIAPIPDNETPETWAGQLLITLQKRKEERWRRRQAER